jgi:hypothetical protein
MTPDPMRRRTRLLLFALVAVAAAAGTIVLAARHQRGTHATSQEPAQKSYEQLVAANYRVLTAAQTKRLLAFADAFKACVSKRGIELGTPKPLKTKLELRLPPGASEQAVLRVTALCGDQFGGPPKDAIAHRSKKHARALPAEAVPARSEGRRLPLRLTAHRPVASSSETVTNR